MTTNYFSTTDTAKLIRAALRESFPGIKFGVRSKSYSGGSSINVSWVDGPTTRQVESITDRFAGAGFDGMTDCKSYHRTQFDGAEVSFGADFVFCSRSYSDRAIAYAINFIGQQFGGELPSVEDFRQGRCWGQSPERHSDAWDTLIGQQISKRTRWAGPAASATVARFDVRTPEEEAPAARVGVSAVVAANVTKLPDHPDSGLGGRMGTALAGRAELERAIGAPCHGESWDHKVTVGWIFATPSGKAHLRDYWSNAAGEWSITAEHPLAALWLARYLRGLGINASGNRLQIRAKAVAAAVAVSSADDELVAMTIDLPAQVPETRHAIPTRELVEYRRQRAAMVPVLARVRALRFALRDLEFTPRGRDVVQAVLERAERQRNAGFGPLLSARRAVQTLQIESCGTATLRAGQNSTQRAADRARPILLAVLPGDTSAARSLH
jgi:hypothetical protein